MIICLAIAMQTFAQPTTSSVRSDGTIMLNGEPFFPFGMYNWLSSPDDPINTRLTDLQAQIDAGFNVSHIVGQPVAHREALMDLADQNDIYLYVVEPNPSNMPLTAPWIKDRKSMFVYEVADDADNGVHSVSELESYVDQVKAIDPDKIAYLTLTGYSHERQSRAGEFAAICDAIAVQAYPITPLNDYYSTDESRALIEAYKMAELYVDAASSQSPKRPLIWTSQAFKWSKRLGGWTNTHPNPRYPTVAESRNMFYAGIVAGAKGIDVYSYSRELTRKQSALWTEIKNIRQDVLVLENALMNGVHTRINTGDEELAAAHWVHDGLCYVAVLNTSYANTKQVSIPLPSGYAGTITPLDSRFNSSLTVAGQNLVGDLAPTDVQVYVVEPGVGGPSEVDITFNVKIPVGEAGPAYIVGQPAPLEWAFNASTEMTLVAGTTDSYTKTITLPVGTEFGYRFTKGNGWEHEETNQLEGCGQIWGNARLLSVGPSDEVLEEVNWGECPSTSARFGQIGSADDISGLKLYPNPASHEVRILGKPKADNAIAHDMAGKQWNLPIVNQTIQVSHLKPGMYILSIANEEYRIQIK